MWIGGASFSVLSDSGYEGAVCVEVEDRAPMRTLWRCANVPFARAISFYDSSLDDMMSSYDWLDTERMQQ